MPERVDTRELITVTGEAIRVPDPDRLTHLQFRRFAGCPVCNLHLRSVVRRHEEILAAGIREVVFFHSPADELRAHTEELPFAVVADPEKRFYAEFGVESAPRSLLDPARGGRSCAPSSPGWRSGSGIPRSSSPAGAPGCPPIS